MARSDRSPRSWAIAALALSACVEPLNENGRQCPCTSTWVCSYLYDPKTCVPRNEACIPPAAVSLASAVTGSEDAAACATPTDGQSVTLIDDLESQDLRVRRGGVNGHWFPSDDHSSGCASYAIAPIPGGRCGSQYAMRLTETGLSVWGAGIGFELNAGAGPNGLDGPLDVSGYTGVQFWAKSGSVDFTFQFKLVDVTGDPGGLLCNADAGTTDPKACYVPFLAERSAFKEWKFYQVPFAELRRATESASDAGAPEVKLAYELLWGIPPDGQPTDWQQYVLWIDDIAWYR